MSACASRRHATASGAPGHSEKQGPARGTGGEFALSSSCTAAGLAAGGPRRGRGASRVRGGPFGVSEHSGAPAARPDARARRPSGALRPTRRLFSPLGLRLERDLGFVGAVCSAATVGFPRVTVSQLHRDEGAPRPGSPPGRGRCPAGGNQKRLKGQRGTVPLAPPPPPGAAPASACPSAVRAPNASLEKGTLAGEDLGTLASQLTALALRRAPPQCCTRVRSPGPRRLREVQRPQETRGRDAEPEGHAGPCPVPPSLPAAASDPPPVPRPRRLGPCTSPWTAPGAETGAGRRASTSSDRRG